MIKVFAFRAVLLCAFLLSTNVCAANVPSQIQAAIADGHLDNVEGVVTANPALADQAVTALLQVVQKNLTSHPKLAAQAMAIASSAAGSVTPQAAPQIAELTEAIVARISTASPTDTKSDAQIMVAALAIAGQPNIVAAMPRLYEEAAAAATRMPGVNGGANNRAQLAQQPSLRPPSIPSSLQQASGD